MGRAPFCVRLAGLPVLVPVLLLAVEFFPPLVTLLLGSGIEVWPRLLVGNGEYPRNVEAPPWLGTFLLLPRAFLVLSGLRPLGVIHSPMQPCYQLLCVAILGLQLL